MARKGKKGEKKERKKGKKKGRRAWMFNSTVRSVAPSFSRGTVTQVFGLRCSTMSSFLCGLSIDRICANARRIDSTTCCGFASIFVREFHGIRDDRP